MKTEKEDLKKRIEKEDLSDWLVKNIGEPRFLPRNQNNICHNAYALNGRGEEIEYVDEDLNEIGIMFNEKLEVLRFNPETSYWETENKEFDDYLESIGYVGSL